MLNIDPVVKVNVNIAAANAARGTFDVGAILGPSAVINTTTRLATYESLAAMETAGFAATSPEYKAAAKYFGVNPAPASVVVIAYSVADGTSETPVTAMMDAIDKGAQFYAVYYCPKDSETAANIAAYVQGIDSALSSMDRGQQFYGATGTISSLVASGGLFYAMNAGYRRSVGLYCTSQTDDAAALMGLAMGMSRTHTGSAFSLCYKTANGVAVNAISETDVSSIKEVNANVCVERVLNRYTIEPGTACSGLRFDEILFIDRIAYEIQTGLYSLIADSDVRLPQNDSTSTLFVNTVIGVLESYYNAGVLATGAWRGAAIGGINTGDMVEHGYNVSVDSFDTQSAADRAARKGMPITALLLLAGAVESVVLNLNVQS